MYYWDGDGFVLYMNVVSTVLYNFTLLLYNVTLLSCNVDTVVGDIVTFIYSNYGIERRP